MTLSSTCGPGGRGVTLRKVLEVGPHGDEGHFALLEFIRSSSLSVSIYSAFAVLRRSLPIDLAPPDVISMDWRFTSTGQLAVFSG